MGGGILASTATTAKGLLAEVGGQRDWDLLQSLCQPHHDAKTRKAREDTSGLTLRFKTTYYCRQVDLKHTTGVALSPLAPHGLSCVGTSREARQLMGATRGQYRRHEARSAGSLKTMQVLTPRGGETLVAPHRHRRSQERGWRCVRGPHPHRAPCALVPRWWNVLAKLRWEWQSYPL
jgi:hypothetical protein